MRRKRLLIWLALGICAVQLIAPTAKGMTPEDIFRRNTEPGTRPTRQHLLCRLADASFLIVTPKN
jgi:hypothetical protein